MADAGVLALVDQHRSVCAGRWRWPWQEDQGPVLDQIDNIISDLVFGDVTSVDDLATDIGNAHRGLTANVDGAFSGITRDLIDWSGKSADGFSAYLGQVQNAIGQYDDILHDFLKIQSGYSDLVQGVVTDASALLNKAISAQQGSPEETWEVVLTAIAAVAAGIGAVVSGPVGWAIVTSAVAGVATEGSVVISTAGPGETAQSLADGLQGLLDDVNDQLARFDIAITQLMANLNDFGMLPAINPPLPGFITAPSFDPQSFQLSNEPPGIQDRVSTGQLVKPPPPDGLPQSSISTRLSPTN